MLPEEINTIVAETGPLDGEIISVSRTADDQWVIEYEPVMIELEYNPTRKRLLLQAEIGPAPEEQRTKLHAAMLSVSFLWRESGGLHMALAGSEGSAVLMADLAGDELTSQTLATVAGNMAERVLVWRGIFANSADSAQAGGDLDAHMDEALIRV